MHLQVGMGWHAQCKQSAKLARTHLQAGESWDRFLPKFRKRNVQRKKPAVVREKKVYTPFPPPQTPSKLDLQLESGVSNRGLQGQSQLNSVNFVRHQDVWSNLAAASTTSAVQLGPVGGRECQIQLGYCRCRGKGNLNAVTGTGATGESSVNPGLASGTPLSGLSC